MSSGEVKYKLPAFQNTFINGKERVVGLVGAKGSSKTWSGARFLCVQISQQQGGQGLVMFNTLQQARDIFFQDIQPLLKELGWPYQFNEQKMVLRCLGSIIHLRSAEPDAIERIESVAYHWGWADEVSFYSPDSLKTFVSRIRKGTAKIRVTSMPDEPDAFMYSFLENICDVLFEISLKDNPDREFADRYEKFLKATYSGPQLERFLSGKRVSLEGEGMFAVESHMKTDVEYKPEDEVLLSWDFNVEYRAVSAWQKVGVNEAGLPIVACVRSWQMKNPTVYEDAVELAEFMSHHSNSIVLHGDASGENRSAAATGSMWKTIRDAFTKKCSNIRYIVPASNPSVKDTIECLNWALRSGLVKFNNQEKNVYMSLQGARADKYGEIDKSMDYRTSSTVKSHECDSARYATFHYFSRLYPGKKGGYFVVT